MLPPVLADIDTRGPEMLARGPTPRATLLIADDEPDACDMLRTLFEDRFDVITVESGTQALEILGSYPVDVVLLDLLMPEVDGLAVLERLRARGCQAQVVVVSGLGRAEAVVAAMRLGAVDYVTKPFDPDHLLSTVEDTKRRTTVGSRPAGVLIVGTDVGHRSALAVALGTRFDVRAAGPGDALRGADAGGPPAVVVLDVRSQAGPADIANHLEALGSEVPAFLIGEATTEVPSRHGKLVRTYRRPLKLGKLVEEIEGLVGRPRASSDRPRIGAQVGRGIEFIGARFREAHIQAVADAAGVSAGHLSRLFRQQLAVGVKEFLDSVRVEVARHLLSGTDEKVQVVARQAGFYDASHLSRVLRRRFGVSPRSFRAS
jgi:DNA-binding NtrC family response regulator